MPGRRANPTEVGKLGHPEKKDWTAAELDRMEIDYDWIQTALTADPSLAAGLAQAYPSDGTMKTPHLQRPIKNDPERCKYCLYRPMATPNSPESSWTHANNWWYGTGNGNHSPHGCTCAKLFHIVGGDTAQFPKAVEHLRNMIKLK